MDRRRITFRLLMPLCAVWCVCVSHSSAADEVCKIPNVATAEKAITEFSDLLTSEACLGAEACKSPDCELVSKLTRDAPGAESIKDPDTRRKTAERVLIVLRRLHDRATATRQDLDLLGVPELQGMLERWSLPTLGGTADAAIARITKSRGREWQANSMDLYLGTPYRLNLNTAFEPLCKDAVQCNANFASIVEVYTISGLIHRTIDVVVKDDFRDVGEMLEKYDARWTAFHTKSLAMFPWELALNNLGYKKSEDGFSGPPNYQWLFLHPSVAMVYSDREDDKLQEAILLDIVGRYRWTWGGKSGAEITKPFGVALAMSWSGGDPGYGLAVHLPHNWSIGVTRSRDDRTQILLSAEFGEFVTDKKKNIDDIRQRLDDLRL